MEQNSSTGDRFSKTSTPHRGDTRCGRETNNKRSTRGRTVSGNQIPLVKWSFVKIGPEPDRFAAAGSALCMLGPQHRILGLQHRPKDRFRLARAA
jgi:hypothetical protein